MVELCSYSTGDVFRCQKTKRSVLMCHMLITVIMYNSLYSQHRDFSLDCCDDVTFYAVQENCIDIVYVTFSSNSRSCEYSLFINYGFSIYDLKNMFCKYMHVDVGLQLHSM